MIFKIALFVFLLSISSYAANPGSAPANTVYAGAVSGGVSIPKFRSLTGADIPSDIASNGSSINLLVYSDNPNFEQGTTGWTASGGTFTAITSGQIYGLKSGQWTASAASQTLYSGLKAISGQPGLASSNCLAAASYSYPSGTSGDYSFVVSDGTNILSSQSLNVTTTAQDVTASFICPASGSIETGLISNVASPSAITLDGASFNGGSVLLGSNVLVSQISQATFVGAAKWVNSSGCNWAYTNNAYVAASPNSSCTLPSGSNLQGQAQAPSTKIPAFTFSSLPPGHYVLIGVGQFTSATSSGNVESAFTFFDGSNTSIADNVIYSATSIAPGNIIEGTFDYTTAQTNVTFQVYGRSNASTGGIINAGSAGPQDSLTLYLYRYPTTTQQAYNASQTPASWSGYVTNSLAGGWTIGSSSFSDPTTAGTVTVTTVSARNMSCTNSGTTAGISCFLPRAGKWKIESNVMILGGTSTTESASLVDGSNNIIDTGKSVGQINGNIVTIPLTGIYDAAASGNVVFKILAADSGSSANIQNSGASGVAPMSWVVEDADAQNSAPVLVSSPPAVMRAQGFTAGASTGAPIIFPSVDFDNESSYNTSTGQYTVKIAGFYNVCMALTNSATATIQLFKNGAKDSNFFNTPSSGIGSGCVISSNLSVGDILTEVPSSGNASGPDTPAVLSISQVK